MNHETKIVNSLCEEWGVEKTKILQTAHRFFTDYKRFSNRIRVLDQSLIDYQTKFVLSNPNLRVAFKYSDEENPSIYFSFVPPHVEELMKNKKGIIYYNEGFIYGLLGDPTVMNEPEFKKFIDSTKKSDAEIKYTVKDTVVYEKKKFSKVMQFTVFNKFNRQTVEKFFVDKGFTSI